jgi:hypothetical protein
MYARGLEAICARYDGRPHWGKQNWATAASLSATYARIDDFRRLRARLDPQCMFCNDYLVSRLGIEYRRGAPAHGEL